MKRSRSTWRPLIQGYQAAGEHVITVGDYNAFEFSDGFVDSLGVIKGTPVPASQVITAPVAGLVNPPLVDLVTLLPAAQRQSYVETGSAQVLDHVVVTSELVPTNTRLVYAHIDSDFPLVNQNDATLPTRNQRSRSGGGVLHGSCGGCGGFSAVDDDLGAEQDLGRLPGGVHGEEQWHGNGPKRAVDQCGPRQRKRLTASADVGRHRTERRHGFGDGDVPGDGPERSGEVLRHVHRRDVLGQYPGDAASVIDSLLQKIAPK